MHIPVIFIWFIIAILLYHHHLRKRFKVDDDINKAFWEKEASSLVVRKKNIDEAHYLHPQLSKQIIKDQAFFDGINQSDLYYHQTFLFDHLDATMVNFQNLTNSDIRLQFGTANITLIETYEENYTLFIKSLYSLGKGLIEAKEDALALIYLEEGIRLGTDIRAHFILIATLYHKQHNSKAINQLYEQAKTLQSLTKSALLTELEHYII